MAANIPRSKGNVVREPVVFPQDNDVIRTFEQVKEMIARIDHKLPQDHGDIYRDQLYKIQLDSALLMKADADRNNPIEVVAATFPDHSKASLSNGGRPAPNSMLGMAGSTYPEWVDRVEDLTENRDYNLTQLEASYKRKCAEYISTCLYKTTVAEREYKALCGTLRDRLINVISARRHRLIKDKELLDIAEGHTALMHPNQFSLTHPGSPSNSNLKRQTRQRRDFDDGSNHDNKKRKRNPTADDDGSPVPPKQPNGTTAMWQNDKTKTHSSNPGAPAPVYKVDMLFTEKELTMTHNTAALITYKHFLTHIFAGTDSLLGPGTSTSNDGVDDSASAPSMERLHSTRSTRGGNVQQPVNDDKVLGLEPLASYDIKAALHKPSIQEPKLPTTLALPSSKNSGKPADAVTPLGLAAEEAAQDLAIFTMLSQYEQKNGRGSCLQEANMKNVLESCVAPVDHSLLLGSVAMPPPHTNALPPPGLGSMLVPPSLPSVDEPTNGAIGADDGSRSTTTANVYGGHVRLKTGEEEVETTIIGPATRENNNDRY